MMKIGFIGAGKIAKALAAKLVRAGYQVILTNSRGPETLQGLVEELGVNARAGSIAEVSAADVIVLSVRWSQIGQALPQLPPLTGKIVIDITNPILDDGTLTDLRGRPSSRVIAALLPGAKVVKTLNHLYVKWIDADPAVENGRRVAFLSGDDPDANKTVSAILENIGFGPVNLGTLDAGGVIQQAGFPLGGLNLVRFPA
jgi:predicted dinucleotide-binding enzyme